MICPECWTEIPESSKFRKECGRIIDLTCSGCGKIVPPDCKICLNCGLDLCQPVSPKDVPKIQISSKGFPNLISKQYIMVVGKKIVSGGNIALFLVNSE